MAEDAIFETRLAAALGRYAELAPAMDDEAISRAAIDAGGRRTGRLDGICVALLGPTAQSRAVRAVYLVALLALLLAAILAAVVGGVLRNESPPLPGRNGPIVYSFGGNNHEAVANVAVDRMEGSATRSWRVGARVIRGMGARWPGCPTRGPLHPSWWAAPDGSRARTIPPGRPGPRVPVLRGVSRRPARSVLLKPVAPVPADSVRPMGRRRPWAPDWSSGWRRSDGGQGVAIASTSTTAGESGDLPVSVARRPVDRLCRLCHGRFNGGATGADRGSTWLRPMARIDAASRPDRVWSATGCRGRPTAAPCIHRGWRKRRTRPDHQAEVRPSRRVPRDLFVIAADGTGDRSLTQTSATEHDPEWSPDGSFLRFETSEGWRSRPADDASDGGSRAGRPPDVFGPELEWFVWSPDGRQPAVAGARHGRPGRPFRTDPPLDRSRIPTRHRRPCRS